MRQRNLLYPSTIVAIVVSGTALVAFAWQDRQDDAANVSPRVGEHWHAAFGVSACGEFVDPVPETSPMRGIHTHGDGLIHIEPSSPDDSGAEATLDLFLDISEIELSDDGLEVGDQSWRPNEDQCDGEDGELVVAQWVDGQGDDPPALITEGFDALRFRDDGEAYTIAFVTEGTTDIPKPPSVSELANVVEPEPDDTAPDPSSTTTPGPVATEPAPG